MNNKESIIYGEALKFWIYESKQPVFKSIQDCVNAKVLRASFANEDTLERLKVMACIILEYKLPIDGEIGFKCMDDVLVMQRPIYERILFVSNKDENKNKISIPSLKWEDLTDRSMYKDQNWLDQALQKDLDELRYSVFVWNWRPEKVRSIYNNVTSFKRKTEDSSSNVGDDEL